MTIDSRKLPNKISAKRVSPQNFNFQKIERLLKSVLSDRDSTPTTMKKVAGKLAIDQKTLSKHFPELCKAISSKYRSHQAQSKNRKIDECCQEVRQAVALLYRKGECPSEARVSASISQPGYFRYKKVRMALKKAKSNINF